LAFDLGDTTDRLAAFEVELPSPHCDPGALLAPGQRWLDGWTVGLLAKTGFGTDSGDRGRVAWQPPFVMFSTMAGFGFSFGADAGAACVARQLGRASGQVSRPPFGTELLRQGT
jgi:hypothetical protein